MNKTLLVLIVDNQPRARSSLQALLSTWEREVQVHEASNGREAVQRAEALQPDIVLMDVRMPELDGVAATQQIKAQRPQVKVVLLSMYSDHKSEALAAGADAFVSKGEAAGVLLDVLERLAQEGA